MKENPFTVPNVITVGRLLCIPVVWVFALQGKPVWVGISTMLLFLTDILDGYLARRLNQMTELGAKLDSLADNLLIPSAVIWLLMLRTEVVRGDHLPWFAAAVASSFLFQLITYLRFRRYPPNLHLYSSKASAIAITVFFMDALVFRFRPWLFLLAAGMFTLSNTEGLLIVLTRSEVHAHIGSIFRKQPSKQARPE